MEREISLPFTPTVPSGARRHVEHAEHVEHADGAAERLQLAELLEQQAEDLAARWERQVAALLPNATIPSAEELPDSPDSGGAAGRTRASALVRALAASMADDHGSTDLVSALGVTFGASAFDAGARAHQLLQAVDLLETLCVEAFEDALDGNGSLTVRGADGVRLYRRFRHTAAAVAVAAARGYSEATDRALQERFRRLRHDLRNPIGTIMSAVSLMADESVPEEARHGPRLRTMIERNAAALDQMIVTRLSDAAAHATPTPPGVSGSAPLVIGEPSDDLARPRQRDDRQAGSL